MTETAERRFSDVLEDLGRRGGETLALGEMVEAFGDRALGAVMIFIAVISLLPWPPGGKLIFSIPLVLIAAEVALLRETLWLPNWITRRKVSRTSYASGLTKFIKPVRFLERLSKPRFEHWVSPAAEVAMGVICVLLAVMLAFPVPLGDMLPAVTIIIFGFALMQRDGLALIAGLVGTVLCAAYLVLVWAAIVEIVQAVVRVFPSLAS